MSMMHKQGVHFRWKWAPCHNVLLHPLWFSGISPEGIAILMKNVIVQPFSPGVDKFSW